LQPGKEHSKTRAATADRGCPPGRGLPDVGDEVVEDAPPAIGFDPVAIASPWRPPPPPELL
jgi:hypothetical protein